MSLRGGRRVSTRRRFRHRRDERNSCRVAGSSKPAVAAEKNRSLPRGERQGTQHAGERPAAGWQTGDVVFISPPVARVAFLREPRAAGRVIRVRMVFHRDSFC